MVPDKDYGLGVVVGNGPALVEEEGLGERGIGRDEHGFDVPAVKNCLPALAQIRNGLSGLLEEVAAIEIGAAVGKWAILRVEIPDDVPSPVIVGEKPFWELPGAQERDRIAGEQSGRVGILGVGESGPSPESENGEEDKRG